MAYVIRRLRFGERTRSEKVTQTSPSLTKSTELTWWMRWSRSA